MGTVAAHRTGHKNDFCAVAEPFLQGEGLPFTEALSAESIQQVFREEDALFGQGDIFSTDIVLWAFLAQTLRDGKGAGCAAAVADIATYMRQTGQRPPSGDTGDYCRARAKRSLPALRRLVVESARPAWMSEAQYAQIPETLTLRELRFDVTVSGRRTETIPVVTTLTDPEAYTKEAIAELYGLRWNVE